MSRKNRPPNEVPTYKSTRLKYFGLGKCLHSYQAWKPPSTVKSTPVCKMAVSQESPSIPTHYNVPELVERATLSGISNPKNIEITHSRSSVSTIS